MSHKISLSRAVLPLVIFAGLANAQDAPFAPLVPAAPAQTVQCRALDALGHPIPKATIQTWPAPFDKPDAPATDIAFSETDENGNFALPENAPPNDTIVRLVHPDYGISESDARFFEPGGAIYFPLVRKENEAEAGALSGIVLDPENHPVAGARVTATGIWAMGHWLLTGTFKGSVVFTDKAGRFRFCVPVGPDMFTASSAPVPQGAWFSVIVREPDFALFPDLGVYRNSEETVIRLVRPEWFHRFAFLGPDGQPLPSDAPVKVYKTIERLKTRFALPLDHLDQSARLAPGRYSAYDGEAEMGTIEVKKDSPEELVFRLPPPSTYVGRVVDGLTGRPLAGAFVTPDSPPGMQDMERIRDQQQQDPVPIVGTDAEGHYYIKHEGWKRPFDSLTAFQEGLLPHLIPTSGLKPDDRGRVALPDAPLFPAAKVLFKPEFAETDENPVSGFLVWHLLLQKEDQPDWFARFSQGMPENGYGINYILGVNKEIPLCVPAGLRLRLTLSTSLSGWEPRAYSETLLLGPGEVKKLDDLKFTPCFKISVRAVDARGKPLAWINLKRLYDGAYVESDDQRRDTDSAGLAWFHVIPGTSGHFAVAALEQHPPAAGQAKAETAFRVPADKAPAEPFVITLSDQQVEQLLKIPPGRK